jgi:hypothetical protein
MIVFRSLISPVPEEDAHEDVRELRDLYRSLALDMAHKREVKSLLADLPIQKARNNSSQIVNARWTV